MPAESRPGNLPRPPARCRRPCREIASGTLRARELLPRIRQGGVVLADNTLWSGLVADPAADDDDANLTAIRHFNDVVAADDRVASYILPVSDGLTVITKL